MAKRRWKPKEIRSVLLKLGFIEKKVEVEEIIVCTSKRSKLFKGGL